MYYPPAIHTIEIRPDPEPDSGNLDPVLGPRSTPPKISSKCVRNLLRHAAKCQFTPYLLMAKSPGK